MEQGSTSLFANDGNDSRNHTLQPKHKVFLSHSGAQKGFVEQLCVDLERCDRHPFFDKRRECLPIGKEFPRRIFEAIEQSEVGVVVLSEEFFTSKWPMLEFVAMAKLKERKPSFTLVLVFLSITYDQYCDVKTQEKWLSSWQGFAKRDKGIDVEDWMNALRLLGPTNALKYNFDLGEVKFREEIVEAICDLVSPRTRFEDSHVQGKLRLCKVIHERITESKPSSDGVHVVGIYGVGGIGKTTICKVMCNELSKEYHDKVCHVELESQSAKEVFKEVLGKLANKNLAYLGAMDVDKYRHHLMRDMMDVKVFLTIDNVSSKTTTKAETLLKEAKYGLGSVLLVTARSLDVLTSLGIDASECMEMPELELEEARSLFLYYVTRVPEPLINKDDLDLISSCIKRCHFKKGDGISCHYHPLALRVLAGQLRGTNCVESRWREVLGQIDSFSSSGETQHLVFSILRSSFEALPMRHQLLFMDVALFAPYKTKIFAYEWSLFEWLGMVYGIRVRTVMEWLENLRTNSVVENLGDGFCKIGMHDLWRDFARYQTIVGDSEKRRWIFELDEYNEFGESILTKKGDWLNMNRMFFLDKGFLKLKDVKFARFPNLTVLKLCIEFPIKEDFPIEQVLDLNGLEDLTSLELECCSVLERSKPLISIVGLGSLSRLVFFRWLSIPSNSACIGEIGCLTNLRVLDLYKCDPAPNVRDLILLEVVRFREIVSITTTPGLSSRHTKLQILDLSVCTALESCPVVRELVQLQVLCLSNCFKLKKVPNLQKLKQLRKLDVSCCISLEALPGLGDLVSLEELRAHTCSHLVELMDMHKLVKLRELDISSCPYIKSLPGLEDCVCLQSLNTIGCKNLTQLPNLYKLTNLQTLNMDRKTPLQSSAGLSNLILLEDLDVGIHKAHDGLDLCNLTMLETLVISGLQSRGISSLSQLVLLEYVVLNKCQGVLPDLKRLSRLCYLEFERCEFEDFSGLCNLPSLEELKITNCEKLEVLPGLRELGRLEKMEVEGCAKLRDLHGILGLQNLKSLKVRHNPYVCENLGPDLHRLASLCEFHVTNCTDLQWLATCSQLCALECEECSM